MSNFCFISKMAVRREGEGLNELYVGRQGLTVNGFDVQDKISALIKEKKCSPLKSKSGDVLAFPALESVFFFFVRK